MEKIIPELMVEDVMDSIDFYNMLGFQVAMKAPESATPVWALLKNGNAEIMLYQRSPFESEIPPVKGKSTGGTFILFIKVNDIKEIRERIGNKVRVIQDLHTTEYGSQELAFTDNSGYIITLSSDQ